MATCILIVIMLISMGALSPIAQKLGPRLVAIAISRPPETQNAMKTHTVAKSAAKAVERTRVPQVEPQPPHPVTPVPPAFINLSKADFAAADLSKMPKRGAGSGQSGNSTAAYGPGEGPGGSKLYNAEWYREPTRAELTTYLHEDKPGWGVIACRTAEHYHVEDCHEISESLGSGFARGMRRAAWQFLVRPPRVDGHPLIGAWVRIRYELTPPAAGSQSEPSDGSDPAG